MGWAKYAEDNEKLINERFNTRQGLRDYEGTRTPPKKKKKKEKKRNSKKSA